MIRATTADRPAVEAFLERHITTSMFPLSNLQRFGMEGGQRRAMHFWVRWRAGGITDLMSVSEEGMLFPQCPTACWGEVKTVLTGTAVKGVIGAAEQVKVLLPVLGLSETSGLYQEEPLYELQLPDLKMPSRDGFSLCAISDATRDLVIAWRRAYLEEALLIPGEDTTQKAVSDIDSYIAADSHRVLFEGETPVAMTGFNATVARAVQIGGVYTPPEQRSRGLARSAVAMHLEQAMTKGAERAILFAASVQACKAYEALGFQRIGGFTISAYEEPQVIYG